MKVAEESREITAARLGAQGLAEMKVDEESQEITVVDLEVDLLENLRCVQTELERHVRVYLEAGDRLVRCSELFEILLKPSPLPDDEWQKVARYLERTRSLAGSAALRQADEELVGIAEEFDTERESAQKELRAALNPTEGGTDLKEIQDRVFNGVWNMSLAAGRLTESCREGADNWLNQIRDVLSGLFGRIEGQRMERARRSAEERARQADEFAFAPDLDAARLRAATAKAQRLPDSILKGGS
jgi:hypothetical protein